VLANAEQDLKAAAAAKHGEARELFEKAAELVQTEASRVIGRSQSVLHRIASASDSSGTASASPVKSTAPLQHKAAAPALQETSATQAARAKPVATVEDSDWVERVQQRATAIVERLILTEDSQNWEWTRIFKPEYVNGSSKIVLFDPHLSHHHQVRNLKEFVIAISEASKPRELLVITSPSWNDAESASAKAFDRIAQDVFQNFGVVLTVKVDKAQHDRAVVCNNGTLFKLGRGLDIYKPATGLASHRHASRRVRRCEIDVFGIPEQ
jgi:hypothetical protein